MELRYIHIFQRERNPDILRVNLAPGKQDNRLLYPISGSRQITAEKSKRGCLTNAVRQPQKNTAPGSFQEPGAQTVEKVQLLLGFFHFL